MSCHPGLSREGSPDPRGSTLRSWPRPCEETPESTARTHEGELKTRCEQVGEVSDTVGSRPRRREEREGQRNVIETESL